MCGCMITSIGSLGAAPFGKKTLILAFEANSAFSCQNGLSLRIVESDEEKNNIYLCEFSRFLNILS